MMPRLVSLNADAAADVHLRTLRVLERVGVRFGSVRALRVLEDAGARVDADGLIAYLTPELVEQAVAMAPREVVLAARDPAKDCVLGRGRMYSTLDGTGAHVLDHRTGRRRPSGIEDLVEMALVADAIDEVDVLWNAVSANDAPANAQVLVETATLLQNTSKHVQGEVQRAQEVPYVMELLALAAGDRRWHPERPTFSVVYCPVAPLQHEREMVEACMALAEHKVPIAVYTLGLSGATAPAALAGAVLQTNAEILSAIVLFQLVSPGTPVVYVGDCGVLDMHSGMYVCAGAEAVLLNSALVGMAHFYGLPVTGTGFTSDAKDLSFMAGLDAATTAVSSTLCGLDLLTGMGMLDAAQMLSLPKLIMDAELMRQCRRLEQGMTLDDEHFAEESIARVGPGGNYLAAPETRRLLRAGEHERPRFFFRGSYDAWRQLGASDEVRAVREVERLLAEHRVSELPPGATEQMEAVVQAGVRELPQR